MLNNERRTFRNLITLVQSKIDDHTIIEQIHVCYEADGSVFVNYVAAGFKAFDIIDNDFVPGWFELQEWKLNKMIKIVQRKVIWH